jgi:PII-like signaling protein
MLGEFVIRCFSLSFFSSGITFGSSFKIISFPHIQIAKAIPIIVIIVKRPPKLDVYFLFPNPQEKLKL